MHLTAVPETRSQSSRAHVVYLTCFCSHDTCVSPEILLVILKFATRKVTGFLCPSMPNSLHLDLPSFIISHLRYREDLITDMFCSKCLLHYEIIDLVLG
jgi:hypothetical protein